MDEQLKTPEQVAEMLQVTKAWVYQLVREGRLTCVKLGAKCLRFRVEDVNNFVENQTK